MSDTGFVKIDKKNAVGMIDKNISRVQVNMENPMIDQNGNLFNYIFHHGIGTTLIVTGEFCKRLLFLYFSAYQPSFIKQPAFKGVCNRFRDTHPDLSCFLQVFKLSLATRPSPSQIPLFQEISYKPASGVVLDNHRSYPFQMGNGDRTSANKTWAQCFDRYSEKPGQTF